MGDFMRVVSVGRDIDVPAAVIFELIAEPSRQPEWDGNGNVVGAAPGQRVQGVGDVFVTDIHTGVQRHNHVVEFEEGRRIAWQPAEPDSPPPGHLWRWELEPLSADRTLVTHTYDWSKLTDEARMERARATTGDKLKASLDRLADHARAGLHGH